MTEGGDELREVVHQHQRTRLGITRLGILTIALEVSAVEFSFLRETLNLTAGNLGGHLEALEAAKLIKIAKSFQGKRPVTSISITPAGRKAFRTEIAMLKSIVARAERAEERVSQGGAATTPSLRTQPGPAVI